MTKLQASTLIESIVAMTLIGIAFGISLIIFLSVINSGNLRKKTIAHQAITAAAVITKTNNNLLDSTWQNNGFSFVKTIEKANVNGLVKLNIKSFDKDSVLIEDYKEFILSDAKN